MGVMETQVFEHEMNPWIHVRREPTNLNQQVTLLTFIRKVPDSTLVRNIGYPGNDFTSSSG